MPWSIKKRKCTQSDGTKGNWVIVKDSTGKQVSCHVTKEDAKGALAALNASEDRLRSMIIEDWVNLYMDTNDE